MAESADILEAIPETPAQLTPQWLTAALGEALGGASVTAAEQRVLGDGAGFVGDIIQLTLTTDQPSPVPTKIVAKLPKLENRAMGELLGAYERENLFYMTLGKNLPVATPRLYHGNFDRDAGSEKQKEILAQVDRLPAWLHGGVSRLGWWIAARKRRRYILLMEDVSSATPYDQLAGVTREQLGDILEATARLHAHFWEAAELDDQFWLLPLDIDTNMRHQLMRRSQDAFAALFPDAWRDGLDRFCADVAERGVEYMQQLADGPATLLHGDLRLDNLFSTDQGVLFIDWQLVRHGAPAYDVAYLLSCGVRDDDSAETLLRTYHTALCAAGIEDYPFETLWAHYKLALKVVLMGLSTVDQVQLGDGRGVPLLTVWMERLLKRLTADA